MEFTICGHDGVSGGLDKNLVALVDAATGEALRKTPAPCSDPMQPRSWDVKDLRGRQVRFEAHDGISGTAFAWLGVGKIAGGPGLEVDFREGLPSSWTRTSTPRETEMKTKTVTGGVPFLDHRMSVVPRGGATDVPCGFAASRLYLLGCTAFRGRPLDVQGTIEVSYREGPPEKYPLMVGFTLELQNRLLGRSKAVYLHATGDAFLYYLVISPRKGVIEKIRLSCEPGPDGPPWISGITCETAEEAPNLGKLPDCRPGAEEAAWIEAHALSATSPRMDEIEAEIRRAHKLP
jgi:hypothetical protein